MPQFAPLDPALAGFDPNNMPEGFIKGIQLQDDRRKLKEAYAKDKELAANRGKRIAAEAAKLDLGIATDTKGIRQLPKIETLEDLILAKDTEFTPLKGVFDVKKLGLDQRNLEPLADAQAGAARASLADSNLSVALSGQRGKAQSAELAAKTAGFENDVALSAGAKALKQLQMQAQSALADAALKTTQPETQLKLEQIRIALANAKTDDEARKLMQEANLALTKAKTEEALGSAAYQMGLGRQASSGATEESKILAEMQKIEDSDIGNGVKFSAYLSNTRGPDGNIKVGFFGGTPDTNPQGERLAIAYKELQDKLLKLKGVSGQSATPSAAPPAKRPRLKLVNGEVIESQ